MSRALRRVGFAGGVAAAAAALALAFQRAQAPPEGPAPVAWSRQPCARCRMLVGEPRFAAQLHTAAGEVLHFDDPGCLLLYQRDAKPDPRATWFHHAHGDRWIPGRDAVFVPLSPSPMGYGLGAVARGESPGALSPDAALRHALAREAERRGAAG
jgi:copper chaperone NosL